MNPNDWLNFVPAQYHNLVLFLLAISPIIGRAIQALRKGGGIKGVCSSIWLGTNTPVTTSAKPVSDPAQTKLPGMAAVFAILCLGILATGCQSSSSLVGHNVTVTQRGFGVAIDYSSASSSPEIKLGFFSSQVVSEPVATNELYIPEFANTFSLDNSTSTGISLGVNETVASGHYMTGNVSSPTNANTVASQPVIPH